MSIKNKIKINKYILHISQYATLAYEFSELFNKFYQHKNISSLTNFTLGALNKAIETYTKEPERLFDDHKSVFPRSLYTCFYDIIKQNSVKFSMPGSGNYESSEYMLYNYSGTEIISSYYVQDNQVGSIKIPKDHYDRFVKIQHNFFWDVLESNNLLLTNEKNYVHLNIKNDNLVIPMSTDKSNEVAEHISKCISIGINRSVLFYGPPGSGKSCMVKSICKEAGLRTLRLRAEDVPKIDNSRLFDVISFMKPDIVIIEDVDKCNINVSMLELYSWLKSNVKLIMSTANEKANLNEALLRPGRFDEYVLVDKIDDNVIYNLLGNDNKDLFDTVKNWPVAYINELKIRFKYMSKERAIKSIQELDSRVKEQVGKKRVSIAKESEEDDLEGNDEY